MKKCFSSVASNDQSYGNGQGKNGDSMSQGVRGACGVCAGLVSRGGPMGVTFSSCGEEAPHNSGGKHEREDFSSQEVLKARPSENNLNPDH